MPADSFLPHVLTVLFTPLSVSFLATFLYFEAYHKSPDGSVYDLVEDRRLIRPTG